jgi:antirestriction protein ArdC
MPTQNEIRERITTTIVEALKSGGLPPWRMPWAADPAAGFPTNVVSRRRYRGINPLLLYIAAMRHGLKSKCWATFNQWKEMGGQVMRRPDNVPPGEWGTGIIFFKPLKVTEEKEEGEEEKTIFMMRTYTVFNVDHVEGEHLNHLRVGHAVINTNPIETYEAADRVIEATNANIRYGGNQAFYNRLGDFIQIPLREQFGAAEYYETVLHELCHWTEAEHRLNWNRKDLENTYAMGELIAEMGSCFLATELGIPNAGQLPNHASYMQSWLKAMQNDTRFIFQASSQASKAADYILAFSRVEEPEEVPA